MKADSLGYLRSLPSPPHYVSISRLCFRFLAPFGGVGLVACGIAENDAPIDAGGDAGQDAEPVIPQHETTSQPTCPPAEMVEAVATAIAATAGESGEPDPGAVRQLSLFGPSLAGIECLENLETLYMSSPVPDNELLRLIPLEKLRYLSLLGNTSLAPLARLSQITTLSINSNDAQDLSPLTQLTALEHLGLTGMLHLAELSPLAELTSLRSLFVLDVQTSGVVHDYSFLAEIPLEDLSLWYTSGIVDFATVDTSRLRSVLLSGTDATNLEEIGAPFGPPAAISLSPADFSAQYPIIAAALCPLGWCVLLDSSTPTVDSSCWESCEFSAD